MPEPLYVRHDRELLNQVASWLLQGQHVGLISEYGTGKTTFREIVRRDLGRRDDFVVTVLDNPQKTTPRGCYETVLQGARGAGYEIDPSGYWQVKDGIPWATDETKEALREVCGQARDDGRKLLLLVDELEDLSENLLVALQVAGDAGVRLFLSGTPAGQERLEDVRATLSSRLRYYEGIDPFAPEDVAEYIARSLAYFRGEEYDGGAPDLFTPVRSSTFTSGRAATLARSASSVANCSRVRPSSGTGAARTPSASRSRPNFTTAGSEWTRELPTALLAP